MKRLFGVMTVVLVIASAMAGCGQGEPPPAAINNPVQEAATAVAEPQKPQRPAPGSAVEMEFLHQPFQAAICADLPTNGLPPLKTVTGKSIGKVYADVEKQWSGIRFVDAAGRRLRYVAALETDLGPIEIELYPDLAPNHVRGFIALVRAGFYDGLFIEARVGDPTDRDSPRAISGGSPEADGADLASVGYWLRPEILVPEEATRRGVRHRPGTFGTVHSFDRPDADGCRFYICLTEAPGWDGEYTTFGQVIRGLEIAETLFAQPVVEEAADVTLFQKLAPIRRATISVAPLEK
jgi:peptidyl-prolyl cis-trans isomerase B (cyclophilin B)